MIYRFYFIAFIDFTIAGTNILDYTNLFSDDYEKNDKLIYISKTIITEESIRLNFRLNQTDETKQRDLMNRKHSKFLFFFYYNLMCFNLCFCFVSWHSTIGIASSSIGLKFVQNFQQLERINQSLKKRERSMIK